MKNALLTLTATAVVALGNVNAQTRPVATATPSPSASATPVTPAERKEAAGTISDVTPDRSLVLATDSDAGEPLVFRFATQVTYVDEDGKVIEAAGLRKNLRVRLSYVKAGGDNVIDKVTILP